MHCLRKKIIPKAIRADRGNENSLLTEIHPSIREAQTDSLSGTKLCMAEVLLIKE